MLNIIITKLFSHIQYLNEKKPVFRPGHVYGFLNKLVHVLYSKVEAKYHRGIIVILSIKHTLAIYSSSNNTLHCGFVVVLT